jgi:SOS response regulatory protein OraA/RecX
VSIRMQALSKTAYNCALEMLARREHSYWELTKKLARRKNHTQTNQNYQCRVV